MLPSRGLQPSASVAGGTPQLRRENELVGEELGGAELLGRQGLGQLLAGTLTPNPSSHPSLPIHRPLERGASPALPSSAHQTFPLPEATSQGGTNSRRGRRPPLLTGSKLEAGVYERRVRAWKCSFREASPSPYARRSPPRPPPRPLEGCSPPKKTRGRAASISFTPMCSSALYSRGIPNFSALEAREARGLPPSFTRSPPSSPDMPS